jgi:hypothetical protein
MTSSFLFVDTLCHLIESGTKVEALLASKVFTLEIDFDEWPTTHPVENEEIRPYNKSLFQIRKHYSTVFPEEEYKALDLTKLVDDEADNELRGKKLFKIQYEVSLLPMIGAHYNYHKDPWSGT